MGELNASAKGRTGKSHHVLTMAVGVPKHRCPWQAILLEGL